MQNIRTYDDSAGEDEDSIIELYLRYDAKYERYQRKIYSLLELLGDIGGLYQSLYVIGFVAINFFAYRIYIASLLK